MENGKKAADMLDLNSINNISKSEYNLKLDAIYLNELVKILNSNKSDFFKILEMVKIYDNCSRFKRVYSAYFKKNAIIPDYLECNKNEYYLICDFYEKMEKNGSLVRAKYLSVLLPFIADYKFSKKVIDDYIASDESYKIDEFCKKYSLEYEDFENIISSVSVLDNKTYKMFLEKEQKNKELNYSIICNNIRDLSFGIKNGFLPNGDNFDILVFLRKMPFRYRSYRILLQFMKENVSECYDVVRNYMLQYGLLNDIKRSNINKGFVFNGNYKINDRLITSDEQKLIYNYIIANDLPTYRITFNIVRDMYINGEINLDSNVKKAKTINN